MLALVKTWFENKPETDIFMMRLNRPHKNNAIDKFLAEHLVIAMKGLKNKTTEKHLTS